MRTSSSRRSPKFPPCFPTRSRSPRSTPSIPAISPTSSPRTSACRFCDKQKLLETISVRERLQKLLPLLNREQEVLNLSSKIQNDVASNIAKTQRDFFLREQMRVIQRELGDTDPNAGEIRNLREKIEQANLPDEARKAADPGT